MQDKRGKGSVGAGDKIKKKANAASDALGVKSASEKSQAHSPRSGNL